jgi:hypothetical protein
MSVFGIRNDRADRAASRRQFEYASHHQARERNQVAQLFVGHSESHILPLTAHPQPVMIEHAGNKHQRVEVPGSVFAKVYGGRIQPRHSRHFNFASVLFRSRGDFCADVQGQVAYVVGRENGRPASGAWAQKAST